MEGLPKNMEGAKNNFQFLKIIYLESAPHNHHENVLINKKIII